MPVYEVIVREPVSISYDTKPTRTELIDANYYQRERDWVTFKDSANKVLVDMPCDAILSIRKVDPDKARTVTVKLTADTLSYVTAMDLAREATERAVTAAERLKALRDEDGDLRRLAEARQDALTNRDIDSHLKALGLG